VSKSTLLALISEFKSKEISRLQKPDFINIASRYQEPDFINIASRPQKPDFINIASHYQEPNFNKYCVSRRRTK
jgi:hypothetical protein